MMAMIERESGRAGERLRMVRVVVRGEASEAARGGGGGEENDGESGRLLLRMERLFCACTYGRVAGRCKC